MPMTGIVDIFDDVNGLRGFWEQAGARGTPQLVGLSDVVGELKAGADHGAARAEAHRARIVRLGMLAVLEDSEATLDPGTLVIDDLTGASDDLVRERFRHGISLRDTCVRLASVGFLRREEGALPFKLLPPCPLHLCSERGRVRSGFGMRIESRSGLNALIGDGRDG